MHEYVKPEQEMKKKKKEDAEKKERFIETSSEQKTGRS